MPCWRAGPAPTLPAQTTAIPYETDDPLVFQLGTLWNEEHGVGVGSHQTGRAELASLGPCALRAALFPPLPHLRPHASQHPRLDSPLNKQIAPEQASSVCFLPARARCCIGTLFAKHSLGFCGLGFGPSHFSLRLFQTPELRMTWCPGRPGRWGGQSAALLLLLTEAQAEFMSVPGADQA